MSSTHSRGVESLESIEGGGFDEMVGKLSPKDRANIEKQLAGFEESGEKSKAELWKRLVGVMSDLAPLPAKTTAQRTVQFYIPDGKWKMQVFAIEDRKEGTVAIYTKDVLAQAVKEGVLGKGKRMEDGAIEYPVKGSDGTVRVEQLDGKSEADPAPFYKDMLGWNRKALRVTLPPNASDGLARAVERICQLAAGQPKA